MGNDQPKPQPSPPGADPTFEELVERSNRNAKILQERAGAYDAELRKLHEAAYPPAQPSQPKKKP